MTTSIIYPIIILGLMLPLAAYIWWYARTPGAGEHGWSPGKGTFWSIALAMLAIVGAWWAYDTDSTMRRTALFEEMIPVAGGVATERTVVVEHPGVVHTLFTSPDETIGLMDGATTDVAVVLIAPGGDTVVRDAHTFDARLDPETYAARWPGHEIELTPTRPGPHRLLVRASSPDVARIHVFIRDPEKRDGERMEGY